MFPLERPRNIKRASALALIAAGLFAYRVHHQPPLISLLQTTARSQFVQSILAPLANAVEKDLQRTLAMVTTKPDAAGDETQRGDAASNNDDLWKADDKAAGADDQKNAADAADQPQDQMQAAGNQEGILPASRARTQFANLRKIRMEMTARTANRRSSRNSRGRRAANPWGNPSCRP